MDFKVVTFLVILVTVIDIFIGHKMENSKKPKESREKCITDILQERLPNLSESKRWSKHNRNGILKGILSLDDFLAIAVIIVFFLMHGLKYVKDIAILYILIRGFRLITMSVTILPQPNKNCKPPSERNTLDRWLSGGCNDAIFSGHMSMMLITLLYISKGVKSLFVKAMMVLFAIGYSLLIIMLRNHYTVDVILAWFISLSTYVMYENKDILFKRGYL